MVHFVDFPEFQPTLTPRQIFASGAFGGTYWRPIHSRVLRKSLKNQHREFKWGLPEALLASPVYNVQLNKYRAYSGVYRNPDDSLKYWEDKGWINPQDPYGWVQWYCRFHAGRRTPDDRRQINRWLSFAGPNGRFRRQLVNMIKTRGARYDDPGVSPVIRQGLLHWGCELRPSDMLS